MRSKQPRRSALRHSVTLWNALGGGNGYQKSYISYVDIRLTEEEREGKTAPQSRDALTLMVFRVSMARSVGGETRQYLPEIEFSLLPDEEKERFFTFAPLKDYISLGKAEGDRAGREYTVAAVTPIFSPRFPGGSDGVHHWEVRCR
ncbi:MAG: hypothetical protein ACOX8S_01780 [Christensenellales bacterium]|jgi:hypothetical protein